MPKNRKERNNTGTQNSKIPPLTIPKVFITSEDDSTPPIQKEEFPLNMMVQRQGYTKDEDSGSTAPLLDSGTATPLCEEPPVPLNMGIFLANSQKLKNEISSEEICLSSFDGDKDPEISSKESGDNQLNVPDYPFVKWPWKYIRVFSTFAVIIGIFACLGSSATLIAHLPRRCDPSTEWWQGKVFYEVFTASFYDSDSDGIGDLNGVTAKLDYLQNRLHVDAIRLSSICEASNYPASYLDIVNASNIDPHIGDVGQLESLVKHVEKRNMSLVIDLPIDHIPGLIGSSQINQPEYLVIENVLKFWLFHGVHGFYIKGLEKYAHQPELWKYIAKWKTVMDIFSSKFSKRRIVVVSSGFVSQYSLNHPLLLTNVLNQVDLIDHTLNLERHSEIGEQIKEVLQWDSDVHKPWIMWNVGTIENSVNIESFSHVEGCRITTGALMLVLSLPGSASVLYGDEIGLRTMYNSSESHHKVAGLMEWSGRQSNLETDQIFSTSSTWALPGWHTFGYSECHDKILESFDQLARIHQDALPLHTNAILKYDQEVLVSRTHNYVLKILGNETLLIERFYPRRHRYLTIFNTSKKNVSHDLSNTYFGGQTLVSSTGMKQGYVKLSQLNLLSGEGLLLLLDK